MALPNSLNSKKEKKKKLKAISQPARGNFLLWRQPGREHNTHTCHTRWPLFTFRNALSLWCTKVFFILLSASEVQFKPLQVWNIKVTP